MHSALTLRRSVPLLSSPAALLVLLMGEAMQSAFPAPSCWVLADATRLGVQEGRVRGFPARAPSPLRSRCIPGFPLRLCLSGWPAPRVPDLVPPVSLCAPRSQVPGSGHPFSQAGSACHQSSPADQLCASAAPSGTSSCVQASAVAASPNHRALRITTRDRRLLRLTDARSCAWFAELCSVRRAPSAEHSAWELLPERP